VLFATCKDNNKFRDLQEKTQKSKNFPKGRGKGRGIVVGKTPLPATNNSLSYNGLHKR